MRITAIHEQPIRLQGDIANAVVDFASHTVSLVAVISDQIRHGKPVVGVAFNSIGRFAQSGILRDRIIPRLLAAPPELLLDAAQSGFSPAAIVKQAMRNEKPGGHGDRAGAVAAIELAIWDLNAKLADEPAYACIAHNLGGSAADQSTPVRDAPVKDAPVKGAPVKGAPVYAAGGYYYPQDSNARLSDEIKAYRDAGYQAYKIKIGGASQSADLHRIETTIDVAGDAGAVAVDANGRFDLEQATQYGQALAAYNLRWYEEPGDPLDYGLLADLTTHYSGALATGENLFSAMDTRNLTAFAGLRPDRDILQMDPGLCYGLTEYLHITGYRRQ